mmetsp:Transcript_9265/g.28803  ORF Transcript_9265/g.28803 Transcript_9265/m.28803 type:complete len:218 (+) Transcript_9265:343-996(+)
MEPRGRPHVLLLLRRDRGDAVGGPDTASAVLRPAEPGEGRVRARQQGPGPGKVRLALVLAAGVPSSGGQGPGGGGGCCGATRQRRGGALGAPEPRVSAAAWGADGPSGGQDEDQDQKRRYQGRCALAWTASMAHGPLWQPDAYFRLADSYLRCHPGSVWRHRDQVQAPQVFGVVANARPDPRGSCRPLASSISSSPWIGVQPRLGPCCLVGGEVCRP